MSRCNLCGPVTRNEAEFAISYGPQNRLLRVCQWCLQDLMLLGFNANQVVHLQKPFRHTRRIPLCFVVLGPVGVSTFLKAGKGLERLSEAWGKRNNILVGDNASKLSKSPTVSPQKLEVST